MTAARAPKPSPVAHLHALWRMEWHDCGFASRWHVVRGNVTPLDYAGDYAKEDDARARVAELNPRPARSRVDLDGRTGEPAMGWQPDPYLPTTTTKGG